MSKRLKLQRGVSLALCAVLGLSCTTVGLADGGETDSQTLDGVFSTELATEEPQLIFGVLPIQEETDEQPTPAETAVKMIYEILPIQLLDQEEQEDQTEPEESPDTVVEHTPAPTPTVESGEVSTQPEETPAPTPTSEVTASAETPIPTPDATATGAVSVPEEVFPEEEEESEAEEEEGQIRNLNVDNGIMPVFDLNDVSVTVCLRYGEYSKQWEMKPGEYQRRGLLINDYECVELDVWSNAQNGWTVEIIKAGETVNGSDYAEYGYGSYEAIIGFEAVFSFDDTEIMSCELVVEVGIIVPDRTGPYISITNTGIGWLSVSASDSETGVGYIYLYDSSEKEIDVYDAEGSSSVSTTFYVSSGGTYYVDATDSEGNWSAWLSTYVTLYTAPGTPYWVTAGDSNNWYTSYTLKVKAGSTPSMGGQTLQIKVDNGGWSTLAADASAGSTYSYTAQSGSHTYYVRSINAAGGASYASGSIYTVAKVDVSPPGVTIPPHSWTNQTITLTIEANDNNQVGLHSTPYSWDNGATWTSEKSRTFTKYDVVNIKVRDALLNTTGTNAVQLYYDILKPTMKTVTASTQDWTNKAVKLTASATDAAASGTTSGQSNGLTYSYSQSTSKPDTSSTWESDTKDVTSTGTWYVWAKDAAGNISDDPMSIYIQYDVLAPVVTKVTAQASDWTNETITLTITAEDQKTDGVSGQSNGLTYYIASTTVGGVVPAAPTVSSSWQESNVFTVEKYADWYAWVKDEAGNISKTDSTNARVRAYYDVVQPQVTIQVDNSTTWTHGDILLTAKPTDKAEGVSGASGEVADGDGQKGYTYYWSTDSTEPTASTKFDGGVTQTVEINDTWYVWVKDQAGNISPVASYKVWNIDKTLPEIVDISVTTEDKNPSQGQTISVTFIDAGDYGYDGENLKEGYSGLKAYRVDQGSYSPKGTSPGTDGWITFPTGDDPQKVEINYHKNNDAVELEVMDQAGNVSTIYTCEVTNIWENVTNVTYNYVNQEVGIGDDLKDLSVTVWGTSLVDAMEVEPKGTKYKSLMYTLAKGDEKYASIHSSTGTLTGVDYGKVTVTATFTDWDGTTHEFKREVKVLDKIAAMTNEALPEDQFKLIGETATFQVQTEGSNNKYTWYVIEALNNAAGTATKITSGQNGYTITEVGGRDNFTSTLTLTGIQAKHNNNQYYCVVSNTRTGEKGVLTVTSRTARLLTRIVTSATVSVVDGKDPTFSVTSDKTFTDVELSLLRDRTLTTARVDVKSNGGSAVSLQSKDTLVKNYGIYGTDNANQYLGLSLLHAGGETDLAAGGSISVTGLYAVRLYNAAAYNWNKADRVFVINLSNEIGEEVEITLTVKCVSKSLSFTVPAEQAKINIQPGMTTEARSSEVTVTNNNAYPLTVAIGSITSLTGNGKVSLPLVAEKVEFQEADELLDTGVKLGVEDAVETEGTNQVFYDPDASSQKTFATLTPEGVKSFRYFVQFSPLHSGEKTSFGYNIAYAVQIPARDVTETK